MIQIVTIQKVFRMNAQNKYKSYCLQRKLESTGSQEQWVALKNNRQFRLLIVPLSQDVARRHQTSSDSYQLLLERLKKYQLLKHSSIQEINQFFIAQSKQPKLVAVCELSSFLSLKKQLHLKPLGDLNHLKQSMIEIASALEYIHSQGIVHDSINLESVGRQGSRFKLCFNEFKEAKKYLQAGNDSTVEDSKNIYWSPEKYCGRGYDQSSDIWSLGIVFIEMMIGEKISELVNGVFPCKIPDFPEEGIAGRLANSEIRSLMYSMLDRESGRRPRAKEVVSQLKEINFLGVDGYEPKPFQERTNIMSFEFNLLPIGETKILSPIDLQDEGKQDSCTYFNKTQKLEMRINLSKSQSRPFVWVKVTSRLPNSRLRVEGHLIFRELGCELSRYFGDERELFYEVKSNLIEFWLKQEGALVLNFDRQRCCVLRQINQNGRAGSPVGGEEAKEEAKILYAIESKLNGNAGIQKPVSYHSESKTKINQMQQLRQSLNNIKQKVREVYNQSKSPQSDSQEEDSKIFSYGREADMIALNQAVSGAQKSQRQQLIEEYQKNCLILAKTEKKKKDLPQAIVYYRQCFEKKSSSLKNKINRQQSIIMIISILTDLQREEELDSWVVTLKQQFPEESEELEFQAYVRSLWKAKEEGDIVRIVTKFQRFDTSGQAKNVKQAIAYYMLYKSLRQFGILSFLEFQFSILMKGAAYLKKFPQNKLCMELMLNIINSLRLIMNFYTNHVRSKALIKELVPQFLPEYADTIFMPLSPQEQSQLGGKRQKLVLLFKLR